MFEAAGDSLPLYVGYSALGELADVRGRYDAALVAWERAFASAAARRAPSAGWT